MYLYNYQLQFGATTRTYYAASTGPVKLSNNQQININCINVHFKPIDTHCCHVGTAIKHLVPDRVKLSFLIFDIRAQG